MFKWEKGRTLNFFSIVYISKGEGVFESRESGTVPIREGMVFLQFPGVWHRYRPTLEIGWNEQWYGFHGPWANEAMNVFSPDKPVLQVGCDAEMVRLFRDGVDALQLRPVGCRNLAAAKVLEIISRLPGNHASADRVGTPLKVDEKVDHACMRLLELSNRAVDFGGLAKEEGLSPSAFRKRFKEATGVSASEYHMQARLQRVQDLLRNSKLTLQEIAEMSGFENAFYLSRLFKRKTGYSPRAFRKLHP